jgi:hypothetical protein
MVLMYPFFSENLFAYLSTQLSSHRFLSSKLSTLDYQKSSNTLVVLIAKISRDTADPIHSDLDGQMLNKSYDHHLCTEICISRTDD